VRNYRKLLLVPALGLAGLLAAVVPGQTSSHREAPRISEDPLADTTDVYAFVSPDRPDTVTFIANWIPLEEPAGGPNFSKFGDDVRYRINIDNNGDASDDIIYEWRFTTKVLNPDTYLYNTGPITSLNDPDFNIRQYYSVAKIHRPGDARQIIAEGLATPPVNIGPRSTPNYESLARAAVHDLPGGYKSFVGQRDDPFFVDLGSIFDLGGLRPLNSAHALAPKTTQAGVDGVGGYNTHTIALQVPITELTWDGKAARGLTSTAGTKALRQNGGDDDDDDDDDRDEAVESGPNSIIGVYSETQRLANRSLSEREPFVRQSGQWINVSRLGAPLVNEVVVPLGKKDRFNASEPEDDAQFLSHVTNPELAGLIPALYPGVTVPPNPRNDLVSVFLTGIPGLNQPPNVRPSEMLRLNMAIPPVPIKSAGDPFGNENHLGVIAGDNAGFPNGRRLADDVTDVELRAVAGGYVLTPDFNHAPNNILGDGVNENDRPFLAQFPYVASPHQGYDHSHHAVGSTNTCC
jgi:hypothetical protein